MSNQQSVDTLISGGIVVTMDIHRRVIADGAVAIKAGRIVAVGERASVEASCSPQQRIDAIGRAVIPGLINGHAHLPMTLFRGLADDQDLDDWLQHTIFPAEAMNVDEAFVRCGTRLGLAELIRGGITTVCDMYYYEMAVAEEVAAAGLRGLLGQALIDFPAPDAADHATALNTIHRFVERWQGHALITPAIAPHAPYTVGDEHLIEAHRFALERDCPLIIHLAESRHEVSESLRLKGARPVEHLARLGVLSEHMVAAHVVWAEAHELDMLAHHGVGVVHNPQSNMKLASGVAPLPQMLSRDMAVGLGTDGSASNNDLSLWEEIDTAAKLHKLITADPKVVSAQQAFELATIRGARALHLEAQIGSLEVGKRADVVVLEMEAIDQVPLSSIYSALVYATKANDVCDLLVNGRVLMRDRQLITIDEAQVRNASLVLRHQIIERLQAVA
ncbi:amidohydrolase [Synechococcus sp. CBW1107]|jgi:5-methylthioadenosine/S-adenosylhomocysteine deaminase|uniref:amidohydrolase family protein n=1 Tax=unclassified Synechococcus TaxID=2626047 RepID=UPI0018CDB509|nr:MULTISPECIES: amidohydrolase [unclassified Synechococcus]QPN57895.1 amidohydrolase [Synechococcus sp. CBW1107]QPN61058.1 amidohydrolase [Synechococcus sp. CBW1002]QPN67277.1 amidohydrolase [Synechococcus sp. CBW1006]